MAADTRIDGVENVTVGTAVAHTLASDPPPTSPFDVVYESPSLRVRRYAAEGTVRRGPPVLLVYSLFKRPYVLDLTLDRSVVRNLTRQGFSVYLTDWLPPEPADAGRGLPEYVNGDLTAAVDRVRRIEGVERIALVGCCLGGFLATIYAALNPAHVERLVVFALPFESRPPFVPVAAEFFGGLGNIPAAWVRASLNSQIGARDELPEYLAKELDEPQLAHASDPEAAAVRAALDAWFGSDVPLTGRLFAEIIGNAYGRAQFSTSRLVIGDRQVELAAIRCPVLNVCAERDRLVPVHESLPFIRHVGSRDASNLVFASSHIGLMVGRAAHAHLWPHVGQWLAGGDDAAGRASGNAAHWSSLDATGTD